MCPLTPVTSDVEVTVEQTVTSNDQLDAVLHALSGEVDTTNSGTTTEYSVADHRSSYNVLGFSNDGSTYNAATATYEVHLGVGFGHGGYRTFYVTGIVLNELTVSEHGNSANSITSTGHLTAESQIPELTIRADDDGVGHLDFLGSFIPATLDSAGAASQVQFTLTRTNDSTQLLDTTYYAATSGTSTLQNYALHAIDIVTNYIVSMWLPYGTSLVCGGGASVITMVVHMKAHEWIRDLGATWAVGTPSYAKAGIPNASLEHLADDITDDTADAALLTGVTTPIIVGQQVEVSPLLDKLDANLRTNVVIAATSTKYAGFGFGPNPDSDEDAMSEAQVNRVFTDHPKPWDNYDCGGMAMVTLAKGLIWTIKPGEFGKLWTTRTMPLDSGDNNPDLTLIQKGAWVKISNVADYDKRHEINKGWWRLENAIKISPEGSPDPVLVGWNLPEGLKYSAWKKYLLKMYYDPEKVPKKPDKTVVGYTGGARFIIVGEVAMRVFDLRTGVED